MFLNEITNEIEDKTPFCIHYHQSSISYIKYIMNDFVNFIEKSNVNDIIKWIPFNITGKSMHILMDHINEIRALAYKNNESDDNILCDEIIKLEMVKYILSIIMVLSTVIANDENDDTILPWDIQFAINSNKDLSKLFPSNNFPLDISIDNNNFIHYVSYEFAGGLLTLINNNHNIKISIFGENIMDTNLLKRFISASDKKYVLSINNIKYHFNSNEFTQGLITYSSWFDINYNKFLSDFYELDKMGNMKPLRLISFI